eukprot:scaffold1506_cov179-Amphora_coffeaeformis.AAC.3
MECRYIFRPLILRIGPMRNQESKKFIVFFAVGCIGGTRDCQNWFAYLSRMKNEYYSMHMLPCQKGDLAVCAN